jgi:hypothetical protein
MGIKTQRAIDRDAIERAIREKYTDKEFRRLCQRLAWAATEIDALVARVPQALEMAQTRAAPSKTRSSIPDEIADDSREALSWLIGTLCGERDRGTVPAKDQRAAALRLIRGGLE